MLTRILCISLCGIFFVVFTPADEGLTTGSAAYAGGGREPDTNTSKDSSGKKSKDKKSKSKEQKAKDRAVREALRSLELTLNAIDRAARNNKLRGILKSLGRLTSLQVGIDTMYEDLDDTEHENKPQAIYDRLTGYARQNEDKELKENARVLLLAIAASREFGRALDAADDYKKAKKAGKDVEAVDHQIEYDDAREDFHRKADKLPRDVRNRLFVKLPREIQ